MTLQAMSYPHLYVSLGTDWKWDTDTVTKANSFLYQLESSFLVCFKILLEVLANLRSLTVKLQQRVLDVLSAYKEVESVISVMKLMRDNSESEFARIFVETTKLGQEHHGSEFELSKPRVAGHQSHRSNIDVTTAEDYYRISHYNEFLSHVIAELKKRFNNDSAHSVGLLHLLPTHALQDASIPQELSGAVDFYKNDLPNQVMFPTEFRMWVRKWRMESQSHNSEVPSRLVDALQACDATTYPNIKILLQVALTLPEHHVNVSKVLVN
ncbi:MAG: hypothetical protein MJE68_12330 [Proteobacteria bacterium]|nr:hypothetical protein [Pseudomonadota bacterium]